MPKVQWIVTTHSPLVLGNFDSNEIIALDQDQQGNIRPLDRQILGFSSDQIYQWLMGTPPTGEAIEQVLEKDDGDDEIAELLDMSPKVSESDAKARVGKLKEDDSAAEAMRQYRRPGVTVPTLTSGGPGGGRRDENVSDYEERGEAPATFPSHWTKPDVRGALYAMHGWPVVSAYCGADVCEAGNDVEHFRPKSNVQDSKAHGGYWWLAYESSATTFLSSRDLQSTL